MKRIIAAVFFCAASVAFAHGRAQAMVEFCPAALHVRAVGAEQRNDAAPAALYGFDLSARSARSVSARLAFDTSGGWFTVDVPQITLTEQDRHYTLRGMQITDRNYASPVMYVRFPKTLTLNHSWIYRSDDVTCAPPAAPGKGQNTYGKSGLQLDAADKDRLSNAPGSGAPVLNAKPSSPLETADCADPFREATAASPVVPAYPEFARMTGASGTTVVDVAINADASVADASVFARSGYPYLDKAALNAAKATTYEAGRSYCRPVPGTYRFVTTFYP